MSSRLRLSRAAYNDLDDIWDYSAAKWNEKQAELYIEKIRATIDRLNSGELHARPLDDVRSGYRSYRVGSHLLLIRETHRGPEVIRILHQNMDVRKWLRRSRRHPSP